MADYIHSVKKSTQQKRLHKADYGRERIEILYEDKDIVVILKPSGILSCPYPGSKNKTAQEMLEKIMQSRGILNKDHKPLVVHRLDRDTSGVMMFALNEKIQKQIMDSWHKMVTERQYRALAENPYDKKKYLLPEGLIDDELAQNAHHVGYVPKNKEGVQTVVARTHYKIVYQGAFYSLFELELDTGKKNQIRAHLSSKHYPLAGDENYRSASDPFFRLCLHARTLEFIHPVTKEKMKFEVPEPEEWLECAKKETENPRPAVWSKGHYLQHGKEVSGENNFDFKSNKSLRKMNFIERGKTKH